LTKVDKTNNPQNQKSPLPKLNHWKLAAPQQKTKQKSPETEEQQVSADYWPAKEPDNQKTYHCFTAAINDPTTGKIH